MPKLVLSFVGKVVKIIHLENAGSVIIGRDEGCDMRVDSILAAPQHARVEKVGERYRVIALQHERVPLQVNHYNTEEHELVHGDALHFGDYTLEYLDSSHVYRDQTEEDPRGEAALWKVKLAAKGAEGVLQILNGAKVGRVITLSQEDTPLTRKGELYALVRYRDDAYFLAIQQAGREKILLNEKPPEGEEIRLNEGDVINLAGIKMEFQEE